MASVIDIHSGLIEALSPVLARLGYTFASRADITDAILHGTPVEFVELLDREDVPDVQHVVDTYSWDSPMYSGRWTLGPEGGAL